MASSSSAVDNSAAASDANRVPAGNNHQAVAPPPSLPPPPPAHVVYLEHLFRVAADQGAPSPRAERTFIKRTAGWLLLLVLLTVLFSFVIWVVFHPTFPRLYIASATISSIIMTNTTVTAKCTFTLLLTNRNRHLTTIYDEMEISLLYPKQRVLLSQIYKHPFELRRKTRTSIETNLSFNGVFLGNNVVEAMKQDVDLGSLSLGINVLAIVRDMNWMWNTRSQFMRAHCGEILYSGVQICSVKDKFCTRVGSLNFLPRSTACCYFSRAL